MIAYIYSLKDPRTNEIRYVGKSNNYKKRLREHIYYARTQSSRRHSYYWIKSLLSLELEPIIEVLEECTQDNWIEREVYWITQFDNLTNLTLGGEGGYCIPKPKKERPKQKKLTDEIVLEIRGLLLQNYSTTIIAEKYNISRLTINDIKLGKTWRHLGEFCIKGNQLRAVIPENIELVNRLYSDGIAIRAIERETKLSRQTIKKILNYGKE